MIFCYWRNHTPALYDAEAIVDLAAFVRERYGVRQFHFGELDFFGNRARVLRVTDAWKRRLPDAVWFALASPVDAARFDDADWDRLAAGGCRKIEFGSEAGSRSGLHAIGKRHHPTIRCGSPARCSVAASCRCTTSCSASSARPRESVVRRCG